jgi:hypothetical protein
MMMQKQQPQGCVGDSSFSTLFQRTNNIENDNEPLNLEETILAPMIAGYVNRDFSASCGGVFKHHNNNNSMMMHNSSMNNFSDTCFNMNMNTSPNQTLPEQELDDSYDLFDDLDVHDDAPAELVSSSSTGSSAAVEDQLPQGSNVRFRKYQACQWKDRFQELMEFRREHGHLLVPHSYPPNQKLAQWVKRQRHQFKRKKMGHHSTLTDEREELLLDVGFIFDSHRAVWHARFETLKAFSLANGHCSIPSKCDDGSLNVWIKHQRRQYLLYKKGAKSTMTEERIQALDSIGFDWNPRNLVKTCNVAP